MSSTCQASLRSSRINKRPGVDYVDVEYEEWARQKDLNETPSKSPLDPPGVLKTPKLPAGNKSVVLKAKHGLVIEDKNAFIIIILIKNVYTAEVLVRA